ncbi:DUF721 domain-containing protein [Beijerinckia indica]|uniref:DUF721 domain-containing protein n=1 Tax=Beijerinckia indica subsp. indica (strain ATCC 9039 / DSM 1715 / NCIMB 8712) TaxID=395963 RepID=B2IGY3_BEII9|nr:DciA family protein [Beijerinckia indica]ACB94397.1 protein of unknown function DUF1159 [Beijerinckia indica subsp. indica ATCC 9039]
MRKPFPRQQPLADLVGGSLRPLMNKQGFGESDLILYWDDIVGERLACMARPIKLQWPARQKAGMDFDGFGGAGQATLVLRVDSAFALDLQHETSVLIERVNAHLGWNCIAKLVMQQGPLPRPPQRKTPRGAPGPETLRQAASVVQGIADTKLRQALTRLGASILRQAKEDQ